MNKSYIHTTTYLTQKQTKAIFEAGEKAFQLGCPLNRFITIHYDDFADPKRPQTFIVDLMQHTRKWLQRRGFPVSYLYTLENGSIVGMHVHLLVHIPRGYQRAYRRAMKSWLPFKLTKPRFDVRDVQYPDYGDLSRMHGVYGILKYMCKGLNPSTPYRNIECKYQGKVMGRRWGISKLLR